MYTHVLTCRGLYLSFVKSYIIGAIPCAYYGSGNGLIHMDDVKCTGDEEHLLNCTYALAFKCWNGYASVNCTVAECTEGKVRLLGGMKKTEGHVENLPLWFMGCCM